VGVGVWVWGCGGVGMMEWVMEKCAMTSTLEGALTTGNLIGPNQAGAPEGSSCRSADIPKHESFD
jgi:hypothetical protein